MSSIKRTIKANKLRLFVIVIGYILALILLYHFTGIERGLGKRKAIYQLLMPNTFYSVTAFANVLLVMTVRPYPIFFENIRIKYQSDWPLFLFWWLSLCSLTTAFITTCVVQAILLLDPGISQIYWQPFLLVILVAFINLLFFQSIILVLFYFLKRINYFFINCLLYFLADVTPEFIHFPLFNNFINSNYLVGNQLFKLLCSSMILVGIILVCWYLSWTIYERRERL